MTERGALGGPVTVTGRLPHERFLNTANDSGLVLGAAGGSRARVIDVSCAAYHSAYYHRPSMRMDAFRRREVRMDQGGGRSARVRVVLLAEVRLFREGLALALRERPEVELIAALAPSADDAETLRGADVVLIDTGVPDLPRLVNDVQDRMPGARVIVFVMGGDEGAVLRCVEAGVSGYVGGDASIDDLVGTIDRVHRGEFACTSHVAMLLADQLRTRMRHDALEMAPPTARDELTARERQVALLIDRGLSNKEIARELGIGLSTVKNHVHHILSKTSAGSRTQVTRRLGVLSAPPWRAPDRVRI